MPFLLDDITFFFFFSIFIIFFNLIFLLHNTVLVLPYIDCWAYTPRKPELKETCVPQCSSQHWHYFLRVPFPVPQKFVKALCSMLSAYCLINSGIHWLLHGILQPEILHLIEQVHWGLEDHQIKEYTSHGKLTFHHLPQLLKYCRG